MEQLHGIVMDRTRSHVILMTPKGEFKRVRVMGRIPEIGDELNIPVAHRRFFSLPKVSWLGVAAAALLLLTASPLLSVINQPPDKTIAPGVAVTEKNNTIVPKQDGEQVDSGEINVAEKQSAEEKAAPSGQEKVSSPADSAEAIIAEEDAVITTNIVESSDSNKVMPDEVKSAAGKPQPGLTVLKTDRKYIDPVKSTGSSSDQSANSGQQNAPVPTGAEAEAAQSDQNPVVSDEDTKNNYMGQDAPGEKETNGLDTHLQKPSF